MKKIYVIQHSINEAYKTATISDVVSAHSTKELAWKRLEEIAEKIEKGESYYFPDTKLKGKRIDDGVLEGYTFEWYDDGGAKMYSHFLIYETTLD